MNTSNGVFAGLAGVRFETLESALGSGIRIMQTYAHLMAPFMMAYTPADPGRADPIPHPGRQRVAVWL